MQFFRDSKARIMAPLGSSSLEDWPSSLENSPGETTPPLSHVSRLEFIVLSLRTAPGLVVLSILWVLFLLGLVFASILLIRWETPPKASVASSTAASLLGKDLGGWKARRLYCLVSQPCDASSLFSEDDPSNLRYEIQLEQAEVKTV